MNSVTAWRLFSSSVSGGKLYDLLLVGNYVLVGWGSVSGTMQYKIERFPSPELARTWAVTQTEAKEKKGYQLDGTVHRGLESDEYYQEKVGSRLGHRGASATFDLIFTNIFTAGARLS